MNVARLWPELSSERSCRGTFADVADGFGFSAAVKLSADGAADQLAVKLSADGAADQLAGA
jgi:hypothetical protein